MERLRLIILIPEDALAKRCNQIKNNKVNLMLKIQSVQQNNFYDDILEKYLLEEIVSAINFISSINCPNL